MKIVSTLLFSILTLTSFAQEWQTNGTDISNTNAGNVGIGTTTPTSLLDLAAPSPTLTFTNPYNQNIVDSTELGKILFTVDDNSAGRLRETGAYIRYQSKQQWSGTGSGSVISFGIRRNNSSFIDDAFVIRNTGRVGIGTASPAGNLDVVGAEGISAIKYTNDSNSPYFTGRKSRGTQDSPSQVLAGDGLVGILGNGYHSSGGYSDYAGAITIAAAEDFTSDANGTFIFFRTVKNGTKSLSERMRIADDGNVGIGTTAPAEKLHVQGPSNTDGSSPVTMRIQSTNTSSAWTPGAAYVRLDFASSDGSGAGSGTKARLAAVTENSNLSASSLVFYTSNATFAEAMRIKGNGDVGIGTPNPDSKLTVKGVIHTQEVKVDLLGSVAPDFVFADDYKLPGLDETHAFIQANKHLPGIPSAREMEENGIDLKEMNLMLLQKVEELTLHLIEMRKELDNLKQGTN